MNSYIGFGVFDCLFTPPSDYSPADDEVHPVGFVLQSEESVEEPPVAGTWTDILGASLFINFVLSKDEEGRLWLSFNKERLPGGYGASRVTFKLSSSGWKQQFPDLEGDERCYAIFDGEYTTEGGLKGDVTLVLFNYRPNMFQFRRHFAEVLALSQEDDFINAMKGFSRILDLPDL